MAFTLILALSMIAVVAPPATAQDGAGPAADVEAPVPVPTDDDAEAPDPGDQTGDSPAAPPRPEAPPAAEAPAPPPPAQAPPAEEPPAEAPAEPEAPPAEEPPAAPAQQQGPNVTYGITDAGTVKMSQPLNWTLGMTCNEPGGCDGMVLTMELPEDILRQNTMTFPSQSGPGLAYTVTRNGRIVTVRFSDFDTNRSFNQVIPMRTTDHYWSVGEKTISHSITLDGRTSPTQVSRGYVTGDVDSWVRKRVVTPGPYYAGQLITYEVGIERKQGVDLTGMNATYVDTLPEGVEFVDFVAEDTYDPPLRGMDNTNLKTATQAQREEQRPYVHEDGQITTTINDYNDLSARWTRYPRYQYRVRVLDPPIGQPVANTVEQTSCTLVHTDVECGPQEHRTATAQFTPAARPQGGTFGKQTSLGYRIGSGTREAGYNITYTNSGDEPVDVTFNDAPRANSYWDPYQLTLVSAEDVNARQHDMTVEYFENREFSGDATSVVSVDDAGAGTVFPADEPRELDDPLGETKYKSVRITVNDVQPGETITMKLDGRFFIPVNQYRPDGAATIYDSYNTLTVDVDGTPIPTSATNPAPRVVQPFYRLTRNPPRATGAVSTTYDSAAQKGTVNIGLGGSDEPRPEGYFFLPKGFTFGDTVTPRSPWWAGDSNRACPYLPDQYIFTRVSEEEFPAAERPVGVGEILHVRIVGDATPGRGTNPGGCEIPIDFTTDGSAVRGTYDSPNLDAYDPNYASPRDAHLPRPELWVRDVGEDGTVVAVKPEREGDHGLEEHFGLERTDPATIGQDRQWHMSSSSFVVIGGGNLGISQVISEHDEIAPPLGDYGRYDSAAVIERGTYSVNLSAGGTLPMNDVVAYDLLPAANQNTINPRNPNEDELYEEAGGTSTMVPTLSGRPTFTDRTSTNPGYELWYSLNPNPCRPETTAAVPGCPSAVDGDFNANGDWILWDESAPADPAAVTALRVKFTEPLTGTMTMNLPMDVPELAVDGSPVDDGDFAINRAVIFGYPEGSSIPQMNGPSFAVLEYRHPSAPIEITKYGIDDDASDPTPIPGAEFAVHAVNEDGSLGEVIDMGWVPGEGGTTRSDATLHDGRYFLVETRSPDGYQLLPQPIAFEMTREGAEFDAMLLDPDADGAVAMVTANGDRDTIVITVADFTIGELPYTGGSGMAGWVLASLLIAVGAIGTAMAWPGSRRV
ncbi:SpaA isopeptide-forming pilin-related protein [uncultured Corynebacterium sp.]|uniref:SpaA isopeptide-forming pilin-related protein n=1 Tax=uncultured Corynebacterium sp. TaxID=159447 RepID=UPI0025D976D0|nr:SpaA isopeptide-forming pilin-related protein [uncultured Corynebacterium sp.]